ncbi:MAG: PilN domain-containing protein [Gammaproteobacteria bacterium]
MSQINLLPWRAEKRKKLKRVFVIKLISALLFTVFLMGIIHFTLAQRLDIQYSRENYYQQHAKVLDQIQTIENLQKNQRLNATFFDELAKILPSGIYLTHIKRENKIFTLNGVENSSADLSLFMNEIEKSQTMTHPVLHEIKTHIFTLQVTQK